MKIEGIPEGLSAVRFGELLDEEPKKGFFVLTHVLSPQGQGLIVQAQLGWSILWDGAAAQFMVVRKFQVPKSIVIDVQNELEEKAVLKLKVYIEQSSPPNA